MTRKADPEVATRAARRLQAALRAMADKDRDEGVRILNTASDTECRWMAGHLLGQVDYMAELLATYAKKDSSRERVLRSAAVDMESLANQVGVAVVIDAAMRREGLI